MKKLLALSLAFSAIIFSASAQQQREMQDDKDQMHQGHHQHDMGMMKDMNFTDAQKAQLKATREEFKAKMEALNKNENITVKEQRSRREALMQEQKAKMDAILTPEQRTKMAESRSKMEGRGRGMDPKRMDMMKTKLGLSDDQVAKWKAQNEATHAQLKAIKEDQSLSSDAKKDKMKAIKEAAKDQRKSIFTADQLKKMKEMRKDHDKKDWKESKK